MNPKRDSALSGGSIGRVQGALNTVHRTASSESLTAHPLLSSHPSYVSSSTASNSDNTSTAPRYVPYTPRQRVAPSSATATTGTTTQASVSVPVQQHTGEARSKLQLMNMKAAAQAVGLDTGTVGWAILDKLAGETDHGLEWNTIWDAILAGKATLLLPLEQMSSQISVTSDFISDHVAFTDEASHNDTGLITLSGLRGSISEQTLTVRSSLSPTSPRFKAVSAVTSRTTAFSVLPPLPRFPSLHSYPTFAVPSSTPSLPLPPRPLNPVSKPALPPRPGSTRPSLPGASRLGNPFSSLFGKPVSAASSTVSLASSPTSVSEAENEHNEVSALAIDRAIIRKDVGKSISKALKAEIKDKLVSGNVPTRVVDRVQDFAHDLYPLLKTSRRATNKEAASGSTRSSMLSASTHVVNPASTSPEEEAKQFQEFYDTLEADMRADGSPSMRRGKDETDFDDGREKERREKDKERNEVRIKETLELVESTLCSAFYDRLFSPPECDDASHDEALSSRVAALNLVDLGLEHLGVDVGQSATEVEVVIKACGEMLTQLSACRSPADKATILVASHKVVADGLSRLPPIRLKSEAEIKDQATPRTSRPTSEKAESEDGRQELRPMHNEKSASSSVSPRGRSPALLPLEPGHQDPLLVTSPDRATPSPTLVVDDALSVTQHAAQSSTSSLQLETHSPLLTVSPPPEREPTVVSGDVLLPMIIFATVKANPPHLVSHLLFIQRFRNASFGGEESYCLVNLLAVADFLENVDLAALGLGDSSKKVVSAADLVPIPVSPSMPQIPQAGLRGRVEQQVDALADSANKVLSGVVDSSFGVLRSFLPGHPDSTSTAAATGGSGTAPWTAMRPGFGLLRRESGFSIASLAASLPGRDRARSLPRAEESGQQMMEVSSRPGSRQQARDGEDSDDSEAEAHNGDEEEESDEGDGPGHDTRSIRSFESMMSSRSKRGGPPRKSLSDRLASVPGLGRLTQHELTKDSPPASRRSSMLINDELKISPPPSRRSSLLLQPSLPATASASATNKLDTPVSSQPQSPNSTLPRLPQPKARFLECTADDLKLSEVGELLQEYRRLVEGMRALGGFEEV